MRARVLSIVVVACAASPHATRSAGPHHTARRLTDADIVARGATLEPVDGGRRMVRADGSHICLRPLSCGSACPTFDANVAAFKQALESVVRPVSCEIAKTGTLCDLRFFRFEGDIYRFETRYFGSDGALLGQTNATDDPEYCGDAGMQYSGTLLDCDEPPRDVQTICTDGQSYGPIRNPAAWAFGT